MDTYNAPILPEPEDVAHLVGATQRLAELQRRMCNWSPGAASLNIEVQDLDAANRELVDQVLGEGEVSILFDGEDRVRIQESVLTGVWRIQQVGESGALLRDLIQVAPIPDLVRDATFAGAATAAAESGEALPEGVCNAPPLIAEINEKAAQFRPGDTPHTINLTLLPQTEQDLEFLDQRLGAGRTTILSRGYGNCRITSTGTRNVWWVRYFNSQDKNILNSLEICAVPEVACAAPEDIADSAERLQEILEIYL
ncbi:hydrogenase expression/formation protein [Mangrovimicrobium sediminis]|uniref:Hydrogenase expression/formation protein n=2 Tax=Mangrovimicrobium sediminis TaxID=2562682 RepID=A0A4Z0M503_9GAMM|nr:hydrogenase expression/formation protein [Haliea sp. SAOS-164]